MAFSTGHDEVRVQLHPDLVADQVAHVELLDVDGRSLLRTEGWSARLPMGGYGPGLRIVRLHMRDGLMWSRGLVYP